MQNHSGQGFIEPTRMKLAGSLGSSAIVARGVLDQRSAGLLHSYAANYFRYAGRSLRPGRSPSSAIGGDGGLNAKKDTARSRQRCIEHHIPNIFEGRLVGTDSVLIGNLVTQTVR